MKRFTLSAIRLSAVVLMLVGCAFARGGKHIEPADTIRYMDRGNTVEYRLVKEVDLGIDLTKRVDERVHLGYESGSIFPRIVDHYKGDGIHKTLFYNEDFQLIGSKLFQKAAVGISRNAQYVTVVSSIKPPVYKGEDGVLKIELYDNRGNELWEKRETTGWDLPGNSYFISEDGKVAIYDHSKCVLTFYDKTGNEIGHVKFFQGENWDPESRGFSAMWSSDGNYFVINARDVFGSTFPNGSGVIFFDANAGKELWRYNADVRYADEILISSDGSYIIASSYDKWGEYGREGKCTYLLNRDGQLIRRYDNILAIGFKGGMTQFSQSGNYALIYDASRKRLYLLDSKSGDRLFKYSLLGTRWHVSSADIAEEGKLIGLIYSDEVLLIHFNGVKTWSKSIPHASDLRLDKDGQGFTVRRGEKLLRFSRIE